MARKHDEIAPLEMVDADLFAPGLLHELRQPLQGADASAALLERSLGSELAAHPDWRILRSQLARIVEIVDGYEDLLRPGRAEPAPFQVAPAVSRAVDLLAHRVRPLARRFAFAAEAGAPLGFGTPSALVHAATNLLANALDAVEDVDGGARVEVRVLRAPGAGVEVRISDEGVGIPEELRDRIFEPRFTTKAPGRGSGLGLHLSRNLMARSGGAVFLVGVEDPRRLGWARTEFCIAVPAAPAALAAQIVASEGHP
jgi:signal transduction histidine kinase